VSVPWCLIVRSLVRLFDCSFLGSIVRLFDCSLLRSFVPSFMGSARVVGGRWRWRCKVRYRAASVKKSVVASSLARELNRVQNVQNVAQKLRSVLSTRLPRIAVRKIHTYIMYSCMFVSRPPTHMGMFLHTYVST
jgi:hypothetical protein